MKKYITAALASAGLVLGTATAFAFDPNATDQNQVVPAQDQPGRALDRARLPNAANGYAVDEPAGADNETAEEHASLKSKAESPSGFIQKVSEDNQAEIRLAQLAQEKSSNPQVKSLAQRLAQDHQANADKLSQLAQQKNVQVSNQLSEKCQKKIDSLSALNGAAFDKHYVRDMIKDHKKDIAFFEQAANNNSDPDVKAFAQSTLPTLKEHLQMAEQDKTMREPAGASNDSAAPSVQSMGSSEPQNK
ncbi:MAG TPA: DUF4142 domain-containing protein [Verrucomicrobiae bacterium]|jgi:putative membrane protein|nr:DUF4142 domain-containing protein [Verrucomicrobiae bacterium]